jgi:hypothetical protein
MSKNKSPMEEILGNTEQSRLLMKIMPRLCGVYSSRTAMATPEEVEAFRRELIRAGLLKATIISASKA